MKTLQAYIDQMNRWNALFKGEQYEVQTAKGRQRVADRISSDLSPENLTCDGELPRNQVQARHRELTTAARELMSIDSNIKFYEFS